jgi:hypothetical protein
MRRWASFVALPDRKWVKTLNIKMGSGGFGSARLDDPQFIEHVQRLADNASEST